MGKWAKEKSITRKNCLAIIRKTFGEGDDMEFFNKRDKQRGSFMVYHYLNDTGEPKAAIGKIEQSTCPCRCTHCRKTKRTKTKRKTTI